MEKRGMVHNFIHEFAGLRTLTCNYKTETASVHFLCVSIL